MRTSRVIAVALASVSIVVAVVGGPAPAPAGAAPDPIAEAALDWLEDELAAHGHAMPGFVPGSPDWGLTADAVLALAAGGRGDDTEAVATTEHLLDHVSEYATWDDVGPEYPGVVTAGAMAKLHLVAEVQGVDDEAATDGFDLEAEVRATMQTTGAEAGRFSDVNPHFPGDNSNLFGQSLAVLGLSYTAGGVPAPAVAFLLAQQCPAGGFRLTFPTTAGCTSDDAADTDASAMAVQALLVVERTPAVRTALVEALDWFEEEQDPATGGFGGTGPTAAINTNSTGLIAEALRAAGRTEAADAAAGWVATMALTAANTGGGPAAGDVGAIAYDPGARDAAIDGGLDDGSRDQWRRSTPQAVLALGLPDLGSIGRDPAEPVGDPRTAAESFVVAAYTDLLGRPPSAGEEATGARRAATSSGKAALLRELAGSTEWAGRLVRRFYTDTLEREPSASEVAYWVGELRSRRRTVAWVAASFYGSPEYFARTGRQHGPWVASLYDRLLHRSPSDADVAFWSARAQQRGRGVVAKDMYQSLESRRDRVGVVYQDILGRPADPGGRDHWARRLVREGDIALAVGLAASGEYAARAAARFP